MHSKRNSGKIKRKESPKEIGERVVIMRAKGPGRPNRMKIRAMEITHVFGRRGTVDVTMNIIFQDLVKDELLVLIKSSSCHQELTSRSKRALSISFAMDQGIGSVVVTFKALRI
jgi:hypothetical protein